MSDLLDVNVDDLRKLLDNAQQRLAPLFGLEDKLAISVERRLEASCLSDDILDLITRGCSQDIITYMMRQGDPENDLRFRHNISIAVRYKDEEYLDDLYFEAIDLPTTPQKSGTFVGRFLYYAANPTMAERIDHFSLGVRGCIRDELGDAELRKAKMRLIPYVLIQCVVENCAGMAFKDMAQDNQDSVQEKRAARIDALDHWRFGKTPIAISPYFGHGRMELTERCRSVLTARALYDLRGSSIVTELTPLSPLDIVARLKHYLLGDGFEDFNPKA